MNSVFIRKLGRRIRRFFEYLPSAVKYALLYPAAGALYRNRDIWLVSERGFDARDNGYHMFRYIREEHPEVECYYIIDKNSADREKVAPYGNVVDYGSIRHALLYYGAKMRISTHIMGGSPGGYFDYDMQVVRGIHMIRRGKDVFLQHGVIQAFLPDLVREKTNSDLFITSAKMEYDYVLDKFGYTKEQVKDTGLARFDALHDLQLKRQILIMPSWRIFLKDVSTEEAKDSLYMKAWTRVVCGDELPRIAREYDVDIIFYPHIEMHRHLDLFRGKTGPRVIIADFDHYDVQTLLKESMLMVTDFSSVSFDFGYMKKPLISFFIDEHLYFGAHYKPGYFDQRTMGFGPVAETAQELFDAIEEIASRGFVMEEKYRKRVDAFYTFTDTHNRERIWQECVELSKKTCTKKQSENSEKMIP